MLTSRRLLIVLLKRLLQLCRRLGAQTSRGLLLILTLLRRLFSLLQSSSSDCSPRFLSEGGEDGSAVVYPSCQPPTVLRNEERRTTLSPDDLPSRTGLTAPGITRMVTVATGECGSAELMTDEGNDVLSEINVIHGLPHSTSPEQSRTHSRQPTTSTYSETLTNNSCDGSSEEQTEESLRLGPDGDFEVAGRPAEIVSATADPASSAASPESPKIVTTSPSKLKHYDHAVIIPESDLDYDWQIKTLMSHTEFIKPSQGGWRSFVHPEGQPYYQKRIASILFTTEADVSDGEIHMKIDEFVVEMQERISRSRLQSVNGIEVVLEIEKDEWAYYIVDHEKRYLLWLERHNANYLVAALAGGVPSFVHMKHRLDCEYFLHLFYFPHDRKLPRGFFDNLIGVLSWGLTDTMTSLDSHTPYGHKELDRFLRVMQIMKEMKGKPKEYAVCVGARLMYILSMERFYNFHGFHGARLTNEQSVRGKQPKQLSGLSRLLSLLLFDVPLKRLDMLDKVYVDRRVQRIQLNVISDHLVDSWQQEVINAAVLLNANVAFLDLDGVLSNGNISILSIGAVASLVSIIMTLCGIIIGLLLTKSVRNYKNLDIGILADTLDRWHCEERGLLSLSVMYSLPYALLVWGAVTFVFAIACLSFDGRPPSPQVYVLAVTLVLALGICAWTVFEVDSWKTLGLKLFPFCFVPYPKEEEEEEQAPPQPQPRLTDRFASIRRPLTKMRKLSSISFTTSPSQRSPQRSDTFEMRRMA